MYMWYVKTNILEPNIRAILPINLDVQSIVVADDVFFFFILFFREK